jgi:hypothetical protein
MISYTMSVCFDVDGEWKHFEEIPYQEIIKALKKRADTLKDDISFDAFDLVDITEYDEE